jgi:hypothetical protein
MKTKEKQHKHQRKPMNKTMITKTQQMNNYLYKLNNKKEKQSKQQ